VFRVVGAAKRLRDRADRRGIGQAQAVKHVEELGYPSDCAVCPKDPSAADLSRGAIVDAALKQGSELIPLVAPGSARLTPRLNQLDVGLRKIFHPRENMTLAAEGTIFNVINSNTVLTESETLGTKVAPYLPEGIGGQPVQISNPRMLRLSLQFTF